MRVVTSPLQGGGRAGRRATGQREQDAARASHHRRRTDRQIHRHHSAFAVGERVFHQKFGNGNVTAVDGNKLTIRFDKAGEKRVVDSFVERV